MEVAAKKESSCVGNIKWILACFLASVCRNSGFEAYPALLHIACTAWHSSMIIGNFVTRIELCLNIDPLVFCRSIKHEPELRF